MNLQSYWADTEQEKQRVISALEGEPVGSHSGIYLAQISPSDIIEISTSGYIPILAGKRSPEMSESMIDVSAYRVVDMEYNELLKENKHLRKENEYFRGELLATNTPQRLQKYSLFYGFLAILSLFFTNFLNINLIHPILAYMAFATSAFFYLMGILMEKQELKNPK